MNLIFLLEERSMKEVLDIILPKILPGEVTFITIPHNGKSDLEASIPKKLKSWNQPNTKFVIIRDQDSGDCVDVKQKLKELSSPYNRDVLIRIACRELESWYFGDLEAVSAAYGKDVAKLSQKSKYRVPDRIGNPKDELKKLIPKHQQIDGARKIAVHMDIARNTSESFKCFVSGVKRLCNTD
ncbi:DUF4276 family protein [Emergencia sp.]|uniref:DUF4276 family protein n=1 Tax=Emergencia sp. TaxID=1926557 RepID=UPI003AEF4ADD